MPGPVSKWDGILNKMKDGQKITLTNVGFQAFLRSARRLNFMASGTKIGKDKYRIVLYKNRNDKKFQEIKKSRETRMNSGNWDVDIYNLPIPESAYPSTSKPRLRVSSVER